MKSTIKNPNAGIAGVKKHFRKRWWAEDYPGTEPRFQIMHLSKDFAIYILIPAITVFLYKSCESAMSSPRSSATRTKRADNQMSYEGSRSQIIDFRRPIGSPSMFPGILQKSVGTLVRVRLLNAVETYSNAPVHAQIVDPSLGRNLIGATVIGDATSDATFNRISMTFRFVRSNQRAIPINARALSLDGTLGLNAKKKEGFFARASLNSSGSANQDIQGKVDGANFNNIILKALTSGLLQEFGSDAQVEKNRSQVLTLQPNVEFFVELTEQFPGTKR